MLREALLRLNVSGKPAFPLNCPWPIPEIVDELKRAK